MDNVHTAEASVTENNTRLDNFFLRNIFFTCPATMHLPVFLSKDSSHHRDIYLEMTCIQICGISGGLFKHMNLPFDSTVVTTTTSLPSGRQSDRTATEFVVGNITCRLIAVRTPSSVSCPGGRGCVKLCFSVWPLGVVPDGGLPARPRQGRQVDGVTRHRHAFPLGAPSSVTFC